MTIIQFIAEMIHLLSKFQASNKSEKKLFLDWFYEFMKFVAEENNVLVDRNEPF